MGRARSWRSYMLRNMPMGIDGTVFGRALQRARCLVHSVGVVERDVDAQLDVDARTRSLTLYEMPLCPYCCKVRRRIRGLGLNISSLDIVRDDAAYNALMEATHSTQVPCLNISEPGMEPRWLFESNDIVNYLEERFGA